MAKLSARGRTCQVEITREYTAEQLQRQHDRFEASFKADYVPGSSPALTNWERVTRRLMSDGKILEKRDVRFRPTPGVTWEPAEGRRHSYGWKVAATLKAGRTAEDYARIYSSPTKSGQPSPWTVSRGASSPTVVISRTRILRAVESGESVGFCKSCGAQADGVEPDAEGYTCATCGVPAVSGAENMLAEIA